MKICPKCKIKKSVKEFHKDKTRKDGLGSHCKECKKFYYQNGGKQRSHILYEKNKEEINKKSKRRYHNNKIEINKRKRKNIAHYLLTNSKLRAKKKNWEHTISEQDIQKELNKCKCKDGHYKCPVLGIRMRWNLGCGQKTGQSFSIDRIDSKKGYMLNNIAIISLHANMLKGNGNIKEFEKIIQYIKERTKQ